MNEHWSWLLDTTGLTLALDYNTERSLQSGPIKSSSRSVTKYWLVQNLLTFARPPVRWGLRLLGHQRTPAPRWFFFWTRCSPTWGKPRLLVSCVDCTQLHILQSGTGRLHPQFSQESRQLWRFWRYVSGGAELPVWADLGRVPKNAVHYSGNFEIELCNFFHIL